MLSLLLSTHLLAKYHIYSSSNISMFANRLTDMLLKFEEVLGAIPSTIAPMMRPFVERVEEVLGQGVTTLNWTSLQHDDSVDVETRDHPDGSHAHAPTSSAATPSATLKRPS